MAVPARYSLTANSKRVIDGIEDSGDCNAVLQGAHESFLSGDIEPIDGQKPRACLQTL